MSYLQSTSVGSYDLLWYSVSETSLNYKDFVYHTKIKSEAQGQWARWRKGVLFAIKKITEHMIDSSESGTILIIFVISCNFSILFG